MYILKNILLLVLISSSLVASSVATITALKGSASIDRNFKKLEAKLGEKLENKDSIITQDNTKVQLIFNDNTIVTIGKNTNFSIEEYIFDDINQPVVSFGLLKGAMRTITGQIGKIAPDKFRVKTKTTNIGIRGTNFTIYAREDNSQNIYCTYGAISVSLEGDTFIVKQGFQIAITIDLKVEIKAFSAAELKELNNKNFGKSKTKKGTISKEKQVVKATQIDTTKKDTIAVVIKDIEKEQQSATNVHKVDSTIEESVHTDYIPPVITTPEYVSGSNLNFGFAINDTFSQQLGIVVFNAIGDQITEENFDGTTTQLEGSFISDYSYELDSDFQYNLLSTPATYNENFQTTFSSIVARNYNGDVSTIPIGSKNSFNATANDLSPNDSMQWGDWAISYNVDGGLRDLNGLWTSGEMTMDAVTGASVISAYSMTSVDYNGIYKAIKYPGYSSQEIVNGTASLNVNFAADTASLKINQPNSTSNWASYSNLMIIENSFIGGVQDGAISESGYAVGTFYGKAGNSVGGSFTIEGVDGLTEANGVYQVTTTTQLK